MFKIKAFNNTPITVQGEALEHGGTCADVRTSIGKARAAFHQLKNTWEISTTTKIRLFNTIVKPILLYGDEIWRTTITIMKEIKIFINTNLRKMLMIRWPDMIKAAA
nr:hypothetical protein BgiMline_020001 [Biomphalaria glabrata]